MCMEEKLGEKDNWQKRSPKRQNVSENDFKNRKNNAVQVNIIVWNGKLYGIDMNVCADFYDSLYVKEITLIGS